MISPVYYQNVDKCVNDIIAKVGENIILGIPLGLGKPNQLINAFFKKAQENPSIHLKIMTALTLEKPRGTSELERRFLEPFVARVFGDYPDLAYILAVRKGDLPSNIEVAEFYFKPGGFLNVAIEQQNYISVNYTHAARDLLNSGINVLAQLIAKKTLDGRTYYSLSSNPDVTLDLIPMLRDQEKQGRRVAIIGQVNNNLPFMYHDAVVEQADFDAIVDNPVYDFKLFGPPNLPVDTTDYIIGINASPLIKDGGTIQIGIGSLGDAITYSCKLRHENNQLYKKVLSQLNILNKFSEVINKLGGTDKFTQGLYGSSEMFVSGLWHLYKSNILKRHVYDNIPIQRLINEKKISETVTPETLERLLEQQAINPNLTIKDFNFLKAFGIFKEYLRYEDGNIWVSDTISIAANLTDKYSRDQIVQHCLGTQLKNGIVLHSGFFLGPQSMYDALRNLDEVESKKIFMTTVTRVNQLYGNEELAILQRKDARFINTAIMATLSGAIVSDGLENGQVISGVGGQYNFVAMAHALPGARAILMLRSTRETQGIAKSNIVWNYGHITIPRHLRDIVLTEYGIADLRGKSDKEIIAALLNITDSRFQDDLLEQAKQAGKIPSHYQIPPQFKDNTPQRLEAELVAFKAQGLFPDFPFGTDFTQEEILLGKVLKTIKSKFASMGMLIKSVFQAMEIRHLPQAAVPYLKRLQLDKPDNWKDELIQRMIVAELIAGGHITSTD
jgi:acyl-CoA hydrolase